MSVRTSTPPLALLLALTLILPLLTSPPTAPAQTRPGEKSGSVRMVGSLPGREKRWALIIGVSTYEDGNITPLPGANNDGRALRDALRDYAGFDERNIVLLTTDAPRDRQPTKNNILRLLGNLSGTVPRDGLLLVAFSGHGIERQNRAFLLASDTPYNDNVRVLERTALSVQDDFKALIRDTGVGQVIILLDACRNDPSPSRSDTDNPLAEAYKNGFSFDVRNREVEAFATLYATSVGQRAYEYTREGKGYFTWAFVEGLRGGAANERGEVTLGGLVRYVERYVPQQVKLDLGGGKTQRPFSVIEGYRAEELIIGVARKPAQETGQTVSQLPNPRTAEEAFWQAIENGAEAAGFQDYLARSARGEFAGVYKAAAELKLYLLNKANAPRAWAAFRETARRLAKYDEVEPFSEGLAEVRLNGKSGFVDETGREVVAPRYEDAYGFSGGLAHVEMNGKEGFINRAGEEVIPVKFDDTGFLSEGLVEVRIGDNKTGKSGFMDRLGKEVVPLKYDEVQSFEGGVSVVKSNGKYGFIDKSGREIVPPRYDGTWFFSEGLIAFADGQARKWGVVDTAGNVVVPPKYDFIFSFGAGMAKVQLNDKEFLIDRTGKEFLPGKYDLMYLFEEGLAAVKLNGKYGYIDKAGKEVIPLMYDTAHGFSDGLAMVRLNGKWGYIDKTGKVVVPLKYDSPYESFKQGLARVTLDGKYGIVDVAGREVVPPWYDKIESFEDGLAKVSLNGKYGFVDRAGRELVKAKYDAVWSMAFIKLGFVGVTLDGRKGIADVYGNEYFDF